MPNPIIVDSFAFWTVVARVRVVVILSLYFLFYYYKITHKSIIFISWCLWLQIRHYERMCTACTSELQGHYISSNVPLFDSRSAQASLRELDTAFAFIKLSNSKILYKIYKKSSLSFQSNSFLLYNYLFFIIKYLFTFFDSWELFTLRHS